MYITLYASSPGGYLPEQRVCDGCGALYWWPGARWQHENCKPPLTELVVNTEESVVVNKRNKDRHKDKGARRVYMREYMRRRRGLV